MSKKDEGELSDLELELEIELEKQRIDNADESDGVVEALEVASDADDESGAASQPANGPTYLRGLRAALQSPEGLARLDRTFHCLKASSPALTAYKDVQHLLRQSGLDVAEEQSDAVFRTLIEERSPALSKGSAEIGMCLMFPMLLRLAITYWRRVGRHRQEELDANIVASFLEAFHCKAIRKPGRRNLAGFLRGKTKDLVERWISHEFRSVKAKFAISGARWAVADAESVRTGRAPGGREAGFLDLLVGANAPTAPIQQDERDAAHARLDRLLPEGFVIIPIDRELLVRHDGCGETIESIARDLGIKADTARQRHGRVLKRLKAALERQRRD